MVDWSDDRIAALSDQDLKNLLVNAERKSAAEIIAQCKAELEKRNAAKPRKAAKPRTELKEFEHEMSGAARRRRQGDGREIRSVRRDRESEVGGREGLQVAQAAGCQGLRQARRHQRDGTVAVDRYISYRRGNDIVIARRLAAQGCADRGPRVSCHRAGGDARRRQAVAEDAATAIAAKAVSRDAAVCAFKDLPSAAAAFDAALAKITA